MEGWGWPLAIEDRRGTDISRSKARDACLSSSSSRGGFPSPGETGAGKGCGEMYEGGWARLGAAEGVGFFEILLQKR